MFPETDEKASKIVLSRIHQELLTLVKLKQLPISFSLGAITYRTPPHSVDDAMKQVNSLMHEVKKQGQKGINHQISW